MSAENLDDLSLQVGTSRKPALSRVLIMSEVTLDHTVERSHELSLLSLKPLL